MANRKVWRYEDMIYRKKINISYTDNSGPEEVTYIEYKHKLKIDMRWWKTKDKDKADVISLKIKNPDITLKEIQNKSIINTSLIMD